MAFDQIETPFGKSDRIVGGAATYIAWSASQLVKPVNQISVVGGDFPQEELDALASRGVNLEGVQIKKRPAFLLLVWSLSYGHEFARHTRNPTQCAG